MSATLYPKLLCWDPDRGRGVAKIDGVTVLLHHPPKLLGRTLEFIDAAPGFYPPELRYANEGKRELDAAELAALDGLLYALTQGATQ